MILLDTDHFSVLRYNDDPRCAELTSRLLTCGDPRVATTVATLEEQLRGWLRFIAAAILPKSITTNGESDSSN